MAWRRQRPDPIAVERLRLTVVPTLDPTARAAVASEPVPTCFDAVVTLDDGRPLRPDEARTFGGEYEAVAAAVHETITRELIAIDVRQHDDNGIASYALAIDGCPYVTTALLSLDRFLPDGTDDALVIAPRYSLVSAVPVTSTSVIRYAARLASVARDLAAGAPDPCSGAVYWWHRGTFHVVDIDPDGTISLPPALAGRVAAVERAEGLSP